MERRLEYEKGPTTDAETEATSETTGEADGAGSRPSLGSELRALPWRAGALFGLGAFLINYAVALQAMVATSGLHGGADGGPGAWTGAGLVMLSSHGASIQGSNDSVPLEIALSLNSATHFSHFVPLVTLVAAGYGLIRYVDRETVRDAATGALTIVPTYLVAMVALSRVARYAPDSPDGGPITEGQDLAMTFAASTVDVVLLAGTVVPATLVLAGGLLAVWPRPLDRLLGEPTDGSAPEAAPRE